MTRGITKTRAAGSYLGDLIRSEFSRNYNMVSGKIVNPSATAITAQNLLGQPVKASGANYVMVKATDEASAIGIIAHDKPVTLAGSAVSDDLYMIIRRGPLVIDKDVLPLKDADAGGGDAGTAFTVATLVTAYAALSPPIIATTDLTPTKEQSY